MRPLRHIRRLRARWRLHRMEWNNMHRPLEPPPGYEKYYDPEEVFPGLKDEIKLSEVKPQQLRKAFKIAWKFYRHSWIPDPKVARILKEWGANTEDDNDDQGDIVDLDKMEEMVNSGIDSVQRLKKRARKTGKIISKEFEEVKPELQKIGQQRVLVLREALKEFGAGYEEASSGKYKAPWEENDEDDSMPQSDDQPLGYKAGTKEDSFHKKESKEKQAAKK